MSALMDKILFTDITVQGERSWCTDEYKGNQKDNGNCDSAESGPLGPAADRIHHDGSVLSSQQITAEQRCASAGPPTVRHNDIDDGSLGILEGAIIGREGGKSGGSVASGQEETQTGKRKQDHRHGKAKKAVTGATNGGEPTLNLVQRPARPTSVGWRARKFN
ncbi:hypothetical protein HZH66_002182 [Vespula vulgaris]|uniref:Uncharacterized protein n=1 Tax=Vespula vulgaris TaxID=7454 RepID=A0A834NG05_VESVU|nr:hypothetical protein HZH66_002182 [Vespula vulgaris]